jgi:signal transduction histidine kinase
MEVLHPNSASALESLFGCLCDSNGLYAKETFLSLYSCLVRILREHRMTGFAVGHALGDTDFLTVTQGLQHIDNLRLLTLDELTEHADTTNKGKTGFLLILTDRLCGAIFWSSETYQTFRMYTGGWSFNPVDTRTLMNHLADKLDSSTLKQLLNDTVIDRRYDNKMGMLIAGLVEGLESRNRDLVMALEQLDGLNQKNRDMERLAAIGQLSSVVAHEIRNPLGLIDLYAKLAEETLLKPLAEKLSETERAPLMNQLSQIRVAIQQLEVILSELTRYARPLTLNSTGISITGLVQSVSEFYRPFFQEAGVGLDVATTESDCDLVLWVDGDKIRQALINLLKNALEVSRTGQCVSVRMSTRGKQDPFLYIKVIDQGGGVSSGNIEKLFTPYFSTKGNGTGLGLAHSRKILQAHGGNVELLSTSAEGSTFTLILPLQVDKGNHDKANKIDKMEMHKMDKGGHVSGHNDA